MFEFCNTNNMSYSVSSQCNTDHTCLQKLLKHSPFRTQSRSCWLLSPWIPIAGHLQVRTLLTQTHSSSSFIRQKTRLHGVTVFDSSDTTVKWLPMKNQEQTLRWLSSSSCYSPISPHFPGKIITPSFGFHKDNCFVFLLTHYFFHQTNKPVGKRCW